MTPQLCHEDHIPAFEMVLEVPKAFQEFLGKAQTRLVCIECHNEKVWYTKFALSERSLA